MQYLTMEEVVILHEKIIADTGGGQGIRDRNGLESAVAQPHAAFGGQELYPSLVEKACALAYSLIKIHPFMDGNKRIGFAAMAVFVRMNGYRLVIDVDDAEQVILGVAASSVVRDDFVAWISGHLFELNS